MTRLIDADALCDRFFEMEDLNPIDGNNGYLHIEEIYEVIDNAPTVNLDKTSFIEGYKAGCEEGKKCYERPQGEWIIKPKENSQSAILICNKCNHFIPVTIDKNYCSNCGAKMKGGAE